MPSSPWRHGWRQICLYWLLCTAVIPAPVRGQGSWQLLVSNAGIASMHTAVTYSGTVIFLDRTDIGASMIDLPNGRCRDDPNDESLTHDCTAHSVEFTPGTNTIRPLYISTDTWCSSGQFFPDGTLVQTGGDNDGNNKIRYFAPCSPGGDCDWVEDSSNQLQNGRWYSTNQLLPSGDQIVVGGRSVFTIEFVPANGRGTTYLPLLQATNDYQNDNYYPYIHLLPNGNLFIFANRDSIMYNYFSHSVIKTYPTIPGEPRNYPSAGSSVMLTLQSNNYDNAEVLVCGGAQLGAFADPSSLRPTSITCGRMVVTDANPAWAMENMPIRRNMGDMIILPTQGVLIINGAQNGAQGWGNAANPVLNPVLYTPTAAAGARFNTLTPTTIPRVYHSTANLLPDGRVLVAGSNTHEFYTFSGTFPTELRVEAYSPEYLGSSHDGQRPSITAHPGYFNYNSNITITVSIPTVPATNVQLVLLSAPYTTHSYSMGQRGINLAVSAQVAAGNNNYQITATAPPTAQLAPPSYYMLFAVNTGIPSHAVWVQVNY